MQKGLLCAHNTGTSTFEFRHLDFGYDERDLEQVRVASYTSRAQLLTQVDRIIRITFFLSLLQLLEVSVVSCEGPQYTQRSLLVPLLRGRPKSRYGSWRKIRSRSGVLGGAQRGEKRR